MTGNVGVQFLGLLLEIVGVGLFSWGEVAGITGLIATFTHVNPDSDLLSKLRQKPWHQRIPLLLAAKRRAVDVRMLDDPLMEAFPPKFWGLVLIPLGFLLQLYGLLGGA
jgi:hypothetical protein